MTDGILREAGEWARPQMYTVSPFERTMFVGSKLALPFDKPWFPLLDHADLVLMQHADRTLASPVWVPSDQAERRATIAELGTENFMRFSTDLVFFGRSARLEAMMAAWYEEWLRWKLGWDLALMRAIHRCPVRIAPIRRLAR